MPVIGFLSGVSPEPFAQRLVAYTNAAALAAKVATTTNPIVSSSVLIPLGSVSSGASLGRVRTSPG
jgi:hypothetical protein